MNDLFMNFILNEYINHDNISNFFKDNEIVNNEEKEFMINQTIEDLKNDLIYMEVEDSINGGETDYYNKYTSLIDLLESYVLS